MRRFLLPLLLLLAGCSSLGGDYKAYLSKKGVTQVSAENFQHCRGYGCRIIGEASLPEEEWQKLEHLFEGAKDPKSERRMISAAIAIIEEDVGAITGTAEDVGGTYVKLGDRQLDCVDESVNTTVYLALLKDRGLLHYHTIDAPVARLPLLNRGLGPHQTAVIRDKKSGRRYAVDSWFHDNGAPAEIISMTKWFFGWRP